jgi:hypothetical protein
LSSSQNGMILFVFQPERIKVMYWKQKHAGHEASKFPTLIIDGLTTNAYPHSYGLPCLEYPGHVKVRKGLSRSGEEEGRDREERLGSAMNGMTW